MRSIDENDVAIGHVIELLVSEQLERTKANTTALRTHGNGALTVTVSIWGREFDVTLAYSVFGKGQIDHDKVKFAASMIVSQYRGEITLD